MQIMSKLTLTHSRQNFETEVFGKRFSARYIVFGHHEGTTTLYLSKDGSLHGLEGMTLQKARPTTISTLAPA